MKFRLDQSIEEALCMEAILGRKYHFVICVPPDEAHLSCGQMTRKIRKYQALQTLHKVARMLAGKHWSVSTCAMHSLVSKLDNWDAGLSRDVLSLTWKSKSAAGCLPKSGAPSFNSSGNLRSGFSSLNRPPVAINLHFQTPSICVGLSCPPGILGRILRTKFVHVSSLLPALGGVVRLKWHKISDD